MTDLSDRGPRTFPRTLAWIGPWAAMAGLTAWLAVGETVALVLAALGTVVGGILASVGQGRVWRLGIVVLAAGTTLGYVGHARINRVEADWGGYWNQREAELHQVLEASLDERLASAERAADSLAKLGSLLDPGAEEPPPAAAIERLQSLRRDHGLAALALYSPSQSLLAWDGVHRGRVPEEVQSGTEAHLYQDLPLFGHLYTTSVDGMGRVAVASHLIRTDVAPVLGARLGDFASEFERAVGESVSVVAARPDDARSAFNLVLEDGRPLFSVVIEEPEVADRVEGMRAKWRGWLWVVATLAWVLLVAGGPRLPMRPILAVSGLAVLLATLPLESVDWLGPLFTPAVFALPGPVPIPLGRLVLLLGVAFAAASALGGISGRLPFWVAALLLAPLLPLTADWVSSGLGPLGMTSGRVPLVVFAAALMASLTVVSGVVLSAVGRGRVVAARGKLGRATPTVPAVSTDARKRQAAWLGVAGGASATGLALVGAGIVAYYSDLPAWWPGLATVPALFLAAALERTSVRARFPAAWGWAGLVGGCVALPLAWGDSVRSQMDVGSTLLTDLSAREAPATRLALLSLTEVADSLVSEGRPPVEAMYGAWRASGLSETPTPLRVSVRDTSSSAKEELRVGVGAEQPSWLDGLIEHARGLVGDSTQVFLLNRDDVRYALVREMSDGSVLSVTAAPVPADPGRSPLSVLVGGPVGGGAGNGPRVEGANLVLIPLLPGDPRGSESLTWVRTATGWQGATALSFENAVLHAHYLVERPGALLLVARGTIIFVIGFSFLAAFWFLGRALAGDLIPSGPPPWALATSFRTRVTVALFGFFVTAVAIFGTLAYRTLNQASARSARVIAERVVRDAADSYETVQAAPGTRLERLSRQVRAELLEYRGGELRGGGSVTELVELGLYEGWMPMDQHYRLDGREGVAGFTETSLGGWRYVTAYRRLPDGDILGAQVPFQAGTTAIRTTDLIELLAFALLMGAALSLILALAGGRALTSPIRVLGAASEGVGEGNLNIRLPANRRDEFGVVFTAFNRMVDRLAQARAQLERTWRRTQAIMDEAAVGMIALDAEGRVMLVNPSARELLGPGTRVGEPIPEHGPLGEGLSRWLVQFLELGAGGATTELADHERRVRVRARRLGGAEARSRGAVLALDDVTDELRAERVLAWGEMARQVAHEVKNPLTPIKLSIQHIQRAWSDGRPDFDGILTQNAEAMLAEIDRLAAIARGFSRFGAPGGDAGTPLTPVDVGTVVGDVMALYRSGAPRIAFRAEVKEGMPKVASRAAELKEVLVNLLENAREAVSAEGQVTVRSRPESEGWVVLEVIDDGCGIPENVQARIFEPRFSTRSGGSGLGLAIVARLVESWGGTVSVRSVVGEGTTAKVLLRVWEPDGDA